MAEICIEDIESIAIDCATQNQVGGVKKLGWIGQRSALDTFTVDADGYVDTLTFGVNSSSTSYQLVTFEGKKFTHSGTIEGVAGVNTPLFNHNAIIKLFAGTPANMEKIEKLAKADDLFVIFEDENEAFPIFGFESGLNMSALAASTGVALQDDTGYLLTLSGEQKKLPRYFKAGSTAATIAYLNNISAPVA